MANKGDYEDIIMVATEFFQDLEKKASDVRGMDDYTLFCLHSIANSIEKAKSIHPNFDIVEMEERMARAVEEYTTECFKKANPAFAEIVDASCSSLQKLTEDSEFDQCTHDTQIKCSGSFTTNYV